MYEEVSAHYYMHSDGFMNLHLRDEIYLRKGFLMSHVLVVFL